MPASSARGPITRLGLHLPDWATGPTETVDLARLAALATAAEESGFDSIWVSDVAGSLAPQGTGGDRPRSPVSPEPSRTTWPAPYVEAYGLLGALAVRTATIGLGALPVGGNVRLPSVVAKIVTGLDVISHGRSILTLAPGAAGGKGPGDPIEVQQTVEAIQVVRAMLGDDRPAFSGQHFHIDGAYNRPGPVRPDGIPLALVIDHPDQVGAGARGADAVVVRGTPARVEVCSRRLDGACETAGRSRSEVALVWAGVLDLAGSLSLIGQARSVRSAGAQGMVVSLRPGDRTPVTPDLVRAAGPVLAGVMSR